MRLPRARMSSRPFRNACAPTLDELVGQTSVLGPGTALRRAIEEGRAPSMILHGPPGVGKTTIARIVAEASSAAFEELSAVSARVDDVRAVLARARDRLGGNGVRHVFPSSTRSIASTSGSRTPGSTRSRRGW